MIFRNISQERPIAWYRPPYILIYAKLGVMYVCLKQGGGNVVMRNHCLQNVGENRSRLSRPLSIKSNHVR